MLFARMFFAKVGGPALTGPLTRQGWVANPPHGARREMGKLPMRNDSSDPHSAFTVTGGPVGARDLDLLPIPEEELKRALALPSFRPLANFTLDRYDRRTTLPPTDRPTERPSERRLK